MNSWLHRLNSSSKFGSSFTPPRYNFISLCCLDSMLPHIYSYVLEIFHGLEWMKGCAMTLIPLIKTQYILLSRIIHDNSISPAIGSIITKSQVKFVLPQIY